MYYLSHLSYYLLYFLLNLYVDSCENNSSESSIDVYRENVPNMSNDLSNMLSIQMDYIECN